ncbi:MAG: hypothetical protein Q4D02_03535 [Clostridia bacterium]|nr:hypothetical protein [Clostridia bacterium]
MSILLFSIFLFLILCFIYNKLMLNSKCVFVLKKDISKGEKLSYDNIQKVIIKNFNQEELIEPYSSVAAFDLKKGQILSNEMISKDEVPILSEQIIIPVSNNVKGMKKGDFVNVYMTTQKENIENIKGNHYVSLTNKQNDTITVKIIENKKILEIYQDEDNKGYIIIEVEKNIALLIENVKSMSSFSLSIMERGR